MMSLDTLQQSLGYVFQKPELLAQALTHRSFSASNNERLEFLGDSVLNCLVGLMLYQRFPHLKEGQLSRLRANLVNQQPLYEIAQDLDLGQYLKLGEGELRSGGHQRPSILADALESILGAAFLDGGFGPVMGVVEHLYDSRMRRIDPNAQGKDAKTRLQEWLQARRQGLPTYHLAEVSGQAHAQEFCVECRIDVLGLKTAGKGTSRKAAEQNAASAALQLLSVP